MVYPLVISAKEEDQELAKALINIPEEYRCFQVAPESRGMREGYMVLGVKQSDHYGWESVSILPERAIGIKFYLGASHLDLFEAYGKSSFPAQAEELFIGYSTEGYKNPDYEFECQYDYSSIVKALSSTKFPKLRRLSLGVSELFCNAHGTAGAIGDITELLENMPNLEMLHIGGYFELNNPICLPKLESLEVEVVGEWEVSVTRPITEETQRNLFLSEFPKLKKFWAELDFYQTLESGIAYAFPEPFLMRENMPSLDRVEFQGFYKLGETKRLEESLLWQKAAIKFSEITESKILAVDVHYQDNQAFVAGITFSSVSQSAPSEVYYSQLEVPSEYQSGEFYKRELPCITKLIKEHDLKPDLIIIDGYVHLDDSGKKGLGAHLADYLYDNSIETKVIGVAKNPRVGAPEVWNVYRGESSKPLYVDSVGIRSDIARRLILKMVGQNRIPTLLKLVDRLCRDKAH